MRYNIGEIVLISSLGLCGIVEGHKGDFDKFYIINIDGLIYYYLHEDLEKNKGGLGIV